MPTTRPRHMITETAEVAAALDAAATRWPDIPSRSALLVRLALEGDRLLKEGVVASLTTRRATIASYAGGFADLYPTAGGRR